MGMSSSQARLLNLTARMHQIEYKAAKLEAMKLQMANESKRVYDDYLNALDATKIQHKTLNQDGSVTFKDVTYVDLCLNGLNMQLNASSLIFNAPASTGSVASVKNQYGLFDVNSGKMYLPEEIATAYDNANGSASAFATALSNYTPPPPSTPTPGTNPGTTPVTPSPSTTSELPATDEELPSNEYDIELSMGDHKSLTVKSDGEYIITLADGFSTQGNTYKITTIGNDVDEHIELHYLENGRLVIKGNNLCIDSEEYAQNDDLIILGSYNDICTNGGNDIIRVGFVNDSNGLNQYSNNNLISTGDGDDYLQVLGDRNIIDSGAGNDKLLYMGTNSTYDSWETECEIDGNIDWIRQQYYGDCQTLSLINSIVNKGTFDQYIDISGDETSGWTVNFLKSNETVSVTPTDLEATVTIQGRTVVAAAKGDVDAAIVEAAIKKVVKRNGDNYSIDPNASNSVSLGYSKNWHIVGKYILGEDKAGTLQINNNSDVITKLYNAYNSGTISNLVVGTIQDENNDNEILGIYAKHAYSVVGVTSDTVTVVNPHDTKDHITLSMTDFLKYFKTAIVFGMDTGNVEDLVYDAGARPMNIDDSPIYLGESSGGDAQKYQYFLNMYNAIAQANGYELISEDMLQSKEWLVNIINSGFAYLQAIDSNNEWYDTSVATNTSLQEVSDESLLRKAEAKYEADMRRIDMKDRKFDTDLAAMDAERNAIKQEMETLKTVAKDNVERTFKLFS